MSPLPWALALWSGALLGACQIDLAAAAWLALAPLSIACHERTPKRGAALGFVTGAVAGSALYGLLPYGGFLYVVICIYTGLNMAAYGAAAAWLSGRAPRWAEVALPALLWTGLEYLRRYGPISFPIMLGPTATELLPLWQICAWTGGHGLSFLVALPAGLLVAWVTRGRFPLAAASAVAATLAVAWWLGAARMASPLPTDGEVRVAGVQSAFDNWVYRVAPVSKRHERVVLDRMMSLTREALDGGAELVIWAETVVQNPILRQPAIGAAVQALADRHDATIVVGAVREGASNRLHNSAVAFRPHAAPVWQDKLRLAGYSEARLTPGTERSALQTPAGRLGIMICLESVYPQDAARFVDLGAELLITSTDDAGFRRSPVAEFHVRRAALRSIETGRWGIHLSQAGPSAIVDPHGRGPARLGFWEQGVIRGVVRRTGLSTPYQAVGDVFSWAVLAAIGGLIRTSSDRASRRAPQNRAT